MSFFFRAATRQRPSPQEIARSIKDSLVALDTKTGAKALEDAEKNLLTLRHTLAGDGEVEPNQEQVLQIALEICKEGVLSLFVQNLPSLGWEARKDLVHCWCILLRQKVDEGHCCVQYIENHFDLLDFLVVCYKNLEVALNCGNMLRECIKYPTLAKMEGEAETVVGSSSKPCGQLEDYYIPDYILKPGAQQVLVDHAPPCPIVVFINSRSGGQLGSSLIKTYRELLNEAQVFDLSEEAPDKVLHHLYANLERLKMEGDILAVQIWRTLRLIVAGGDGTASWLLGVVSDLKLSHPPPVATVPLGTGNNLPFSFGWGKKNPSTDQEAVKSFLGLVKHAREMKIDREDEDEREETGKRKHRQPANG